MKKSTLFLFGTLIAAAAFTSCSKDDDDNVSGDLWKGDLSAPKYEADAVLYTVQNNSEIGTVELTESGNYIVMPPLYNYGYNAPAKKETKLARMFRKQAGTRYDESMAAFGEYTKKGNSYDLKGYGILTPTETGFELELNNGETIDALATKSVPVESNKLNDRFCRTWHVTGAQSIIYDEKGKKVASYKFSSEEIKEELVKYVIVSKAGTFSQVDWDNTVDGYGEWRWDDKAEQIFGYRWLDEYDPYWGMVQVLFDGKKATFRETYEDYEEEYGGYILCVDEVYTENR